MLYNLIFNLIIIHVVCDFYLQTSSICESKILLAVKGKALWTHTALVGLLSWAVVWDCNGWWLALLIAIGHFIIDWVKSYFELKCKVYVINEADNKIVDGVNRRYDLICFIFDQFVHIGFICLISYVWFNLNDTWTQFQWFQNIIHKYPLIIYSIVALSIVIKPVNILILQILRYCKLENNNDNGRYENFHAGAIIGYSERILMTIFIILSQYQALGFLIAAKSILRFTEASSGNTKSEYVLTGTLLSLVFSLILGLCVIKAPII